MKRPLEVEAAVDHQGRLRPQALRYRGRRYPVVSHGRRWIEGSLEHFLVMTPGGQVFELAYDRQRGQWLLLREPHHFRPPSPYA